MEARVASVEIARKDVSAECDKRDGRCGHDPKVALAHLERLADFGLRTRRPRELRVRFRHAHLAAPPYGAGEQRKQRWPAARAHRHDRRTAQKPSRGTVCNALSSRSAPMFACRRANDIAPLEWRTPEESLELCGNYSCH